MYTVRPGDTLSGIAQRLLGGARHYDRLFAANRDVLASPDALRPGMQLRIPTGDDSASSSPAVAGPANGQRHNRAPSLVRSTGVAPHGTLAADAANGERVFPPMPIASPAGTTEATDGGPPGLQIATQPAPLEAGPPRLQ
jgi:LysM repeat protein